MKTAILLFVTMFLAACGSDWKCGSSMESCGNLCMPKGHVCCGEGNCDPGMICSDNHTCTYPGSSGSGGSSGGSGGGSGDGGGSSGGDAITACVGPTCAAAHLCNSNGVCCPRNWYGCKGTCVNTRALALQMGCTDFKTCCLNDAISIRAWNSPASSIDVLWEDTPQELYSPWIRHSP